MTATVTWSHGLALGFWLPFVENVASQVLMVGLWLGFAAATAAAAAAAAVVVAFAVAAVWFVCLCWCVCVFVVYLSVLGWVLSSAGCQLTI